MSESQEDMLSRLVAEAVEARQHVCERCGHDGKEHVFDLVSGDISNPCLVSCLKCMEKTDKEKGSEAVKK